MLQEQMNNILGLADPNTVHRLSQEHGYDIGYLKFFMQLAALFMYLILILAFGKYLWNQGLHIAFPGVVAHIGPGSKQQLANPYLQLLVSLFAILFIF